MIPAPVQESLAALKKTFGPAAPDVAVVLGSGLGVFADALEGARELSYTDIPHFPAPTVVGHAGRCVFGRLGDRTVLAFCGRFHAYEGHPPEIVTLPVRLLGAWGARHLAVTNASGGIRADFAPGTLMMIADHVNLTGANPLRGPNLDALGERFPDMSEAYDARMRAHGTAVARRLGLSLREGVYVGVSGPSYETPAEIRAFRALGGDAVGMSTVPEVIVAKHQKMRVFGLSMITNAAAGTAGTPITHEEVIAQSKATQANFVRLLVEWVKTVALDAVVD